MDPARQVPRHRRRIKLIKPRLQLRMIGSFLGLCTLGLLAQTLVLGSLLLQTSADLPIGGAYLARELPTLLLRAGLLSLGLLMPALLLIGTHITFRIAGPLFRFERHLAEVARGKWPEPCRLRKGDDLQEMCSLINRALDSAREQGEEAAREEQDLAA